MADEYIEWLEKQIKYYSSERKLFVHIILKKVYKASLIGKAG